MTYAPRLSKLSKAQLCQPFLAHGTFFACDTPEQYFGVQLGPFLIEKMHLALKYVSHAKDKV